MCRWNFILHENVDVQSWKKINSSFRSPEMCVQSEIPIKVCAHLWWASVLSRQLSRKGKISRRAWISSNLVTNVINIWSSWYFAFSTSLIKREKIKWTWNIKHSYDNKVIEFNWIICSRFQSTFSLKSQINSQEIWSDQLEYLEIRIKARPTQFMFFKS